MIIAPHPDDETLGAGGMLAKFSELGHETFVLTISGHLPPLYLEKDFRKTKAEALKAYNILGVKKSKFLKIPATYVGQEPIHKLNSLIYNEIDKFQPTIVLSPYPDRHIDHKLIFDSVMVASRPVGAGKKIKVLAAYETLSETHWNAPYIEPNFTPNWVIDISENMTKKIEALKCYKSQIPEFPGPRSIKSVEALAVFRGTQAGFKFGEGMHIIRKIT